MKTTQLQKVEMKITQSIFLEIVEIIQHHIIFTFRKILG